MAPFYLTFVRYVNTTRIAPDKKSVQASLPRGNIYKQLYALEIYEHFAHSRQ